MNWKRGLKRIYIVVWIPYALVGVVFACTQLAAIHEPRDRVMAFIKSTGNRVTVHDIETLEDATLANKIWPPSGFVPDDQTDMYTAKVDVLSDNFEHPGWMASLIVTEWLLACGLAPALLLGITAWIIRGFEKQPSS